MKSVLLTSCLTFLLSGCENSQGSESVTEADVTFVSLYEDMYEKNGFLSGIKAEDYVTLCDYSNINLYNVKVDEEVEDQIEAIMESFHPFEKITDRSVKEGDVINVRYHWKHRWRNV